MEHEIRYRGELLGFHPSKEEAEKHLAEHHTGTSGTDNRLQHHSQTPEDFVIQPRQAFELRCRGNLVDTFSSEDEAWKQIESRASVRAPIEVWEVQRRAEQPQKANILMIDCIVFSDFTNGTGKAQNGEVISTDILAAHAAAVQEQLCGPVADSHDIAPTRTRVGAPNGADVGPGEWLMGYWQTPDQPGAAGYHTTDPSGNPYGKVFLDDAMTMTDGPEAASVIASHEGCEMRADPSANLLALRGDGATFDAFELCDAVEDTTYKASNGVEVSNFLLAAAFDPGAVGPFDYLKQLADAYAMTPGGYRTIGAASIAPDGSIKMLWKAVGPGLEDPKKKQRKMRQNSRAQRRKVEW